MEMVCTHVLGRWPTACILGHLFEEFYQLAGTNVVE
jgi:hypothetical protein